MFLSYGRSSRDRLTKVAELVSDKASVLDVCCGPCNLYPLLRKKNITYVGLDINDKFVQYARRRGIDARLFDLKEDILPKNEYDYILMQSSLYQFIPNHINVIHRLLTATKHYVIIAEPIRNLVDRLPGFVSEAVKRIKDPGTGPCRFSFTDESLSQHLENFKQNIISCDYIKGGKEKIYLLEK